MNLGISGKIEYLEYLMKEYDPYESLDEVIYRELGPMRYAAAWSRTKDKREDYYEQE